MLKYWHEVFQIRGQTIHKFLDADTCLQLPLRPKWTIDRSKVPQLDEKDLKEKFIKGGGPGGTRVGKCVNCVQLIHEPTGLSVKCHEDRSLERNRKIARNRLVIKLDNLFNGEDSIENQKKRIEQEKKKEKDRRRRKRLELKEQYKISSNIEDQTE